MSNIKEQADRMIAAVRTYVARALAPLDTRLSAVETRTGALSMILGTGKGAEKIAQFERLELRIKALEDAMKQERDAR